MAIDMGSELENQNRQVDRINLKVRLRPLNDISQVESREILLLLFLKVTLPFDRSQPKTNGLIESCN
ncbi:hypothetical protein NQ317_019614 [Molorchus minor]|uniref:t-SNARE coiled-coil homology domain-containing protein n=1 Tax=Molorchus minor TaxID=1323400 RepID=A0ABQ9J4J6_9CUCU|nr:hypothetical protein NQ317_019614 [Molorchus minor]